MHQAYLLINGVRTQITTFGRWVEESSNEKEQDIIVVVPGNPGVNGFYDLFAKTLHEKLGYPVWCIGHAGHNIPEENISPLPKLKDHKELYGLKGQIEHKAKFFEEYLPKNSKVHLIGHSIGSYMLLELLEHPALKDKVVDVYLLFPTIEYMATTSYGKFMNIFIRNIVWLVVLLSWVFTFFPRFLQNALISIYMLVRGVTEKQNLENIRNLIKPGVLRRVFFLAFEELDQVKERNNDVIKNNLDKIKFYYGRNDGWAPNEYCNNLKRDIPNVNAQVSNYNHAFVLNCSVEIGYVVSDWIKARS